MRASRRRQFLRLSSLGIVAWTAGCTDLDQPTTELIEFHSVNYTDTPRTLTTEITAAGETQYTETVELDGIDGQNAGGFDDHPSTLDQHVIHAWHDTHSPDERVSFDVATLDHECAEIIIQIGPWPHTDRDHDEIQFMDSVGCPGDS